MTGIALTRKRTLVIGAVVLMLGLVATFSHLSLTRASAGPLRHDDTLRTTKVDETWHVEQPRNDVCMDIRFKGTVSGNARPTWGITGPTTVWENLRVHGGYVEVKARQLGSDGACRGRATWEKVIAGQAWRTGDADWRGWRQTRVTSGKGSSAWNGYSGMTVHLDGGAYDRDEAYRTTLAVSVEPYWRRNGMSTSDGFQVEHTVELPVG